MGKILIQGGGRYRPDQHEVVYCEPPKTSGVKFESIYLQGCYDLEMIGTLWQCDCGRYWYCYQRDNTAVWWKITKWRAKRITKRRSKS